MIEAYIWIKWAHIISSTVLFGTGIGTAFQMWMSHRSGNIAAIATTTRNVVIADWLFTTPAGIIQPLTGVALIFLGGHTMMEPWLATTYALYIVALVCWLPVVWLQLKIRDMAQEAMRNATDLPHDYHRYMRMWFALGWPAFAALIAIFYLMVAKPTLW